MADDKKNIGPEAEKPSRNILLKAQTWLSGQNGQGSCRKTQAVPRRNVPKYYSVERYVRYKKSLTQ